jgi:hypothetical protein
MVTLLESEKLCGIIEKAGWELADITEEEYPSGILRLGHEYVLMPTYSQIANPIGKGMIVTLLPGMNIEDPHHERWNYMGMMDWVKEKPFMFQKMLPLDNSLLLYNGRHDKGIDVVSIKNSFLLETFKNHFLTVEVMRRIKYNYSTN